MFCCCRFSEQAGSVRHSLRHISRNGFRRQSVSCQLYAALQHDNSYTAANLSSVTHAVIVTTAQKLAG